MRALVTNDDGIESPGLEELVRVATQAGLDLVVAAPHEERSGTGAALTATTSGGRILTQRTGLAGVAGVTAYAVEATPAYITWAAVRGAFGQPPELVLSGVNLGPNTGHAVLHSGTVGAALTANAHGLPAVSLSTTLTAPPPSHLATAGAAARTVLAWMLARADWDAVMLNLNVPDVPLEDLRGIRTAPLASFGAVQADVAEVGEGFVTLTFSEIDASSEPQTDAALQVDGWATVTALTGPREVELPDLVELDGAAPAPGWQSTRDGTSTPD
jgi:5'-nucleotidase